MSKDNWSKRNKLQTWFLDVFPKYLLLLILIGCIVAATYVLLGPAVGNVYSNIYVSESWCTWYATAKSWLDENENGKWDTTEPPLPGVQFSIGWDDPISDFKGEGSGVLVKVYVCDSAYQVPVSAMPPRGYRPTTSTIITSSGGGGSHGPFLFGFAYLPGVPTATPRPQLQCNSYANDHYDPVGIAIAPDGKVWMAAFPGGIARYDPVDNTWVTYTPLDGYMTSVAISESNGVWVSGTKGVARFNGTDWKSYSTKDGLVADKIHSIAIMPDGTVWFGTREDGASRFDPVTGSWTTYTEQNGLGDNWVATIVGTKDGSVWLGHSPVGSSHSLSRLLPGTQTTSAPVWKIYEPYTTMSPIEWISEIAVAADDTLWIAGDHGLGHLEPLTGAWQYYEQNYLANVAIAPDGSVWAGTDDAGARHFIPAKNNQSEGTWEIYRVEDGLADNHINDIAVARDGSVWFATAKGLSHCAFDSKR